MGRAAAISCRQSYVARWDGGSNKGSSDDVEMSLLCNQVRQPPRPPFVMQYEFALSSKLSATIWAFSSPRPPSRPALPP